MDAPETPTASPSFRQRLLNPYGFSRRGAVLYHVLILALAFLTMDRLASHLFWPAPESQEVLLLGSPTCPHSSAAREHLVEAGVPFRELSTHDDPVRSALASWAFQTLRVPVVVVGGEVIYGNRRDQIDAALATLDPPVEPAG